MALLALVAAARCAEAQLTDTVAIGVPYPLGDSGSIWQLAFTPAGSKTAFDRCPSGPPCRSEFTPDHPGEYIATLGNASIHLQAVDLRRWSRGEVPIMADTFGANAVPTDSASGRGFWDASIPGSVGGCVLEEKPGARLRISTGGGPGPCGLRTRDGCPALEDAAGTGCGFASGATTVNPFADSLIISLGNLSLPPGGSGAVRLTSNETARGAIELHWNDSALALRWAQHTSAGQRPQWIELHSAPLGRCQGSVRNMSMSLAIKKARLGFACTGDGPEAAFSSAEIPHGIDWRAFAPSTGGELSLAIMATAGEFSVGKFEVASLRGNGHLRAQLAPLPNLNGGSSPYLGASHSQKLSGLGYLDPTKPPFSADAYDPSALDPSRSTAHDSTAALQAAIDYCRTHSLTLWLPSGDYLISDTLIGKQTERLDAVDVSRHDIAAIWVAFFSRWQRYRC